MRKSNGALRRAKPADWFVAVWSPYLEGIMRPLVIGANAHVFQIVDPPQRKCPNDVARGIDYNDNNVHFGLSVLAYVRTQCCNPAARRVKSNRKRSSPGRKRTTCRKY
jgi:hypothetical protein